ncbi:MAG: hypothetical protein H6868_03120 [Rhodospirillales bacterium]|nr:hypothetical protein [Rhodospirillales bacterium]
MLSFKTERGDAHDPIACHKDHMHDLSCFFRQEVRETIERYRVSQTTSQICHIRALYLDAEGKVLRHYLQSLYSLYRQSHGDYMAMHRRLAQQNKENGQSS